MGERKPDKRAIFCEALEQKSSAERARFLDAACGNDALLRAEVEGLLSAHGEVDQFLGGNSTFDQPASEQAGSMIGPYKLLQQIGEGGMGVVYMAEQTKPVERRVALKIIKLGMDSRQVIARFEAERQALAMMDHPNITKVLDAGITDSGRPYFVMELVKGMPITDYCDQQHLTARRRLELFLPVCRAVQHAHHKGIIHRDLKPSNVMVSLYDDRPVPKVIDFGVAKATSQKLTEKTMFTQYGQIVGTLEYMSPEQAKLNQLDIDTRSDIYSLGVLLYELLTGTTPFDKQRLRSSAFEEIMRIIRDEEPPKPSTRVRSSTTLPAIAANRGTEPRKLSALIHGELDWIVMKALEKDRARRYESASGMAADIERYLKDEQVVACPPSPGYRFRKFARRNAAAMTTAAIVSTALLLGTAVSTWQAIRATKAEIASTRERNAAVEAQGKAEREAERADTASRRALQAAEQQRNERLRAVRAERRIHRQAYVFDMAYACRMLRDGDNVPVSNLLDRHVPDSATDLRGFEWYYLWRHCHTDVEKLRHWGPVRSFAFSPNGQILATAFGHMHTVGEINLWQTATGKLLRTFNGLGGAPVAVEFSPDAKTLASLNHSVLTLWGVDNGSNSPVLREFLYPMNAIDLAFSPDGQFLAIVGWSSPEGNGILILFEVATGREQSRLNHDSSIRHVMFSSNGEELALIDRRGRLLLSKVSDLQKPVIISLEQIGHVTCSKFAPDSATLAIGSREGVVHVLDIESQELRRSYRYHKNEVRALGFSSYGDRLVSSSAEAVVVWETNTQEPLAVYPGTGRTEAVFSPDGNLLASGTMSRIVEIKRLNVEAQIDLIDIGDDEAEVFSQDLLAEFSPDGKTLALVRTGKIMLWDVATGKKIVSQSLRGPRRAIGFGFSQDGRAIAASLEATKVKLWDVNTGDDIKTLDGNVRSTASCIAFSPDIRTLALGGFDGTLRLWDVDSGRLLGVGKEHGRAVFCVAFSADGNTIASGGEDDIVRVWDRDTCRLRNTLPGHLDNVVSLAFSPTDPNSLASGSFDTTIKLWDIASGQPRATLEGHSRDLWAMTFSPDGRRLAANGLDHVKLWNPRTGDEVGSIGPDRANAHAFSPDGTTLATWKRETVRIVKIAGADDVQAELGKRPLRAELQSRERETIEVVKQAIFAMSTQSANTRDESRFPPTIASLESALQQLKKFPDYYATYAPRVCVRLAAILAQAPHEQTGDPDRVSRLISEALRLEPSDPTLWHMIGSIRSNQGDWEAAKNAYENAVRYSVYRTESAERLAWFLATCPEVTVRDPDRAERLAREAVELRPSRSIFWKTLGIALYRQGRWQEAVDALVKSNGTNPFNPAIDGYLFLAMSHWKLNNMEQARKRYDEAVEQMETETIAGKDHEFRRFRDEASQLLNIAE